MITSPHLAGRDRYERSMEGWVDNTHEDAFTHTVRLTDDDAGVELAAVCTPSPGYEVREAAARALAGAVDPAAAARFGQLGGARMVAGFSRRLAEALAATLANRGFRLVSGGTDNHLMLVNLTDTPLTGKDAQEILDRVMITVNKNTIPFETKSPMVTSGIRLGTPAVTTRGMREPEMAEIAGLIDRVLSDLGSASTEAKVRDEVQALTNRFPLYPERTG